MSFPYDGRTRTFEPGMQVPSADLNEIEDAIIDLAAGESGDDFVFYDDFTEGTNSDPNPSKWPAVTVIGTATVKTDVTIANSDGVLNITATGGDGSGGVETINLLSLTTLNFRMRSRIRLAALGGSGSNLIFSLGNANAVSFQAVSGTANWQAVVTVASTPTPHDTGVAIENASFHSMEIRRKSGVVTFLIDGNVVYAETVSLDLSASFGNLVLSASRSTSGTTTAYADFVKLRHKR